MAHAQYREERGIVTNFANRWMWIALAAGLAACSGGPSGVRFTSSGSGTADSPKAQPIRALAGGEVSSALAGKTFQYTRSDGNGFVTYAADGTFSFQDDVKGEGTGRWSFQNGQYCETFGASAQKECGEFKTTGDAYFAAKSRLVEMKG
jgi:hypothetical protein